MKRDDGINREHRVGSVGFAWTNPDRITVAKDRGMWRVFLGTGFLGGYGTFGKAITMAHGYARAAS